MAWLATSILSATAWAAMPPQPTVLRPETERYLREWVKKNNPEKPAVCSIPLLAVPIAKNVERMPTVLPPPRHEQIDRMPSVKVPAPPCKEEKR